MAWTPVVPLSELAEAPHLARAGTRQILLVRQGEQVHATEALCPHKFTSLADGHVADGCIVCPLHDGGFDLATGAPRAGDEWAGRLGVHPVRIVDGVVEVDL